MSQDSVLFDGSTDLNHYQVIDTIYSGRPARVLYSGNRLAAQSGAAHDDNPELLFDYNERFMELIRGVQPSSLLIIGGGAFTLPAAVRSEFPDMLIDVVELDGKLPDIATRFFNFRPDNLLCVHITDGALFLRRSVRTYDVIIIDVFQDTVIPEPFQSASAAEYVKRRLSANGIAAINAIGTVKGERSAILHRLGENFQANFPSVELFPATYGLSDWTVQNFVMTATAGQDPAPFLRYPPVQLL